VTATEPKLDVDKHLMEKSIAQLLFKAGPCRAVAVAIAKAFLDSPGDSVWSDEVQLPELAADDKNVIGTAWKNLARLGLVQRQEGVGDHRRSTREASRGRTVWRYRIMDAASLRTFLARNGGSNGVQSQPELL